MKPSANMDSSKSRLMNLLKPKSDPFLIRTDFETNSRLNSFPSVFSASNANLFAVIFIKVPVEERKNIPIHVGSFSDQALIKYDQNSNVELLKTAYDVGPNDSIPWTEVFNCSVLTTHSNLKSYSSLLLSVKTGFSTKSDYLTTVMQQNITS